MSLHIHPLKRRPMRILVLNPNSSRAMTSAMSETLSKMRLTDTVDIQTYTAPSGPASINDSSDLDDSALVVYKELLQDNPDELVKYDAILIACYSVHPLVEQMQLNSSRPRVTGIFEASILTAMSLLQPYSDEKWGVVTTGKFWESHLSNGVGRFLGLNGGSVPGATFAGVFSTGLNAGDFHGDIPQEVVREKLKEAASRLLRSSRIRVIVMGCAGMAGLEDLLREAASECYGDDARDVHIVDAVQAGVLHLEQALRSSRTFRIGS